MRIIGIIRVSTDQQAGENDEGLERQRHALRQIEAELRKQHPDLVVMRPIEVRGVSGSDLADTPEWRTRIVPALQAGAHLMADSVDRVVRASHQDTRTLQALAVARRTLYTRGKSYDTTDPRDNMMLTVIAAFGGFEKAEIIRRAQAGKEEKRKRGEWVSRLDAVPHGTAYDRQGRRWTLDPAKAGAVLTAYANYAQGASLAEVAAILGVSVPGVRRILSNPIYRGVLRYDHKRSGEKYASKDGRQAARRSVPRAPEEVIEVRVFGGEGQEPQLVPDDLWHVAAGRVDASRGEGRRRRERTRPGIYLSGLLFSQHEWDGDTEFDLGSIPKHVIYGESSGEDRPLRYACRCKRDLGTDPHAPRPRCSLRYFHARDLNNSLDRYLHDLTHEAWGIEHIREQLRQREDADGVQRERERLEGVLASLKRQESRLTDLLLEDRIEKEEHDQRQDELRRKRDATTRQLSSLSKPVSIDLDAVGREWRYDRTWSPERKRAWVLKWCRGITVSNTGVENVTLRLPASDGSSVLFSGGGERSWEELAGGNISSPEGRLAADGHYLAGQVVAKLGWEPGTRSTNKLNYWVRSGKIPAPSKRHGLKLVWTEADLKMLLALRFA